MIWMEFLTLVFVTWVVFSSIGNVGDYAKKLESKIGDLSFKIGRDYSEYDETIMERLRRLEFEVFGESGETTYEDRSRFPSCLHNLKNRVNTCGDWLQLGHMDDESELELDDVTYCIRSAAD